MLNNQKDQNYTRNACTIYTLLDIVQLQYGVKIETDYIIKICEYFERLGKWSSKDGAVFKVIFEAFVWAIGLKLGLKFKVVTSSIKSLIASDTRTWGIGTPKLTKDWYTIIKDGVLTEDEGKIMYYSTNKGFGHSLSYDNGYISDHFGNITKCDLDTLKRLVTLGLFWNQCRTIEPADDRTRKICEKSIEIVKNRKLLGWKDPFLSLDEFKKLFL